MDLNIPIKVEIKARAASSWTKEHVDARLEKLRNMERTDDVKREIEYLEKLLARK